MKEIEWLVDHIDEEIEGANEYADKALACKDKNYEWANTYMQMSHQELAHAEVLHSHAVHLIENFRGEVPAGMAWVWEREHKKYIDKVSHLKMKQEMLRK